MTIDAFLAAVRDGRAHDRERGPYSPAAERELRWWLGGHLHEALGAVPIDEVRLRDVAALVDELRYAGISPRRLRRMIAAMRALFDFAGDMGLVAHNPAERLVILVPGDMGPAAAPGAGVRRVADRGLALATGLTTLVLLVVAATFLLESL
jgi:hypothetical protein